MNVFVTGATGYIGSAVANALLDAGHQVTGLARSDEATRKLNAAGVRSHQGNLSDLDSLADAARAADAVIHTASANDATSPQTDPPAITRLLETLAGTVKPFIYTAGSWDVGDTQGQLVDEDFLGDPPAAVAWRPAVVRDVLAASNRGVRSVVIRPTIVYGYRGGILAMFVQSARQEGAARYIGDGQNHWSCVHVNDLARLYRLALDAPAGTLLFGAAGDPQQVHVVAEAASRAGGAEGRTQAWPLAEARAALGPVADALALDQCISGSRAQTLLGWKPQEKSVLEALSHGSYAPLPEK